MALNCKLENDILRTGVCGYSLKQVTDIYLANYSEVSGTTLGTEGNTIATITMTEMTPAAKWYHIEPNKDSATYSDELQVGDAGSKYRMTTLTWSMGGIYDGTMADNLDDLALGRYVAVVKLSDGNYIMFGRLTPLEASVATLSSAAEANGFNGIQVTLTNNTVESPKPLEEAAINVVLNKTPEP